MTPGCYDIIILGGGCAGLSLALRLADAGRSCPSVLILEQRAAYSMDRTWCFWDDGAAAFGWLAGQRWKKVSLRSGQESIDVDCRSFSYCRLAADLFYDYALTSIRKNDAINLVMERAVKVKPTLDDGLWRIATNIEIFTGKRVIDTRPRFKPARGAAVLWQSFLGCEVTCQERVFDPERAVLMDFLEPRAEDIRFNYVLPFSPTRALIEATSFGAEPLRAEQLTAHLDSALRHYARQSSYSVERSEYAVLPMGVKHLRQNADPTFIQAGLTAGGARNSSGYAFQRIQRWAAECARNILDKGMISGHRRDHPLHNAMDHLFLRVMREDPLRAPALFLSLFARADSESVIRFLSDRASFADCVGVISALPAAPFLRQVCQAIKPRGLADAASS